MINHLIKGNNLKCQRFKNQICTHYNSSIKNVRQYSKVDYGSKKHPLYEFSKYFKPENCKIE
jgi:hypothetical protein